MEPSHNQILTNARIIQGALTAGIAFFSVVIGILYMQGHTAPVQSHFLETLSLMNAVVFAGMWVMGPVLQRYIKSGKVTNPAYANMSPDQVSGQRWLAGRLMVLAPREGSALFGLVACLMAVQTGVIHAVPLYWLNALPAIAMIFYSLSTFPSQADFDPAMHPETVTSIIR